MEGAVNQVTSKRAIQALLQPRGNLLLRSSYLSRQHLTHSQLQTRIRLRYASSSSQQTSPPSSRSSKPVVLEKPDKFRPPSHGSRRNARSTTSMYGTEAAYNQSMTARERQESRSKSYPHTFPNQGTTMHWFLTTRWVHVTITMVVLLSLALTSIISTWSQTSPFAHLIPPLNMAFFSPLNYFSELFSVWRLHQEYMTQKTAESRRQNILDAQKRRLYRRAHGMEDLTADEVSGPDVRGLVEWDDGLTNKERERGGQYKSEMIGAAMQDMGQRPGEDFNELMERKRREQAETAVQRQEEGARKKEEEARAEQERLVRIGARRPEEDRPRRKVWFGIWG